MPLSVLDLGIQETPAYIHKIDRPTYWNTTDDIEERARNAASSIFKRPDNTYSFWKVESDLDFYSIAASLNANRSSPSENICFIWVTRSELDAHNLPIDPVAEGKCFHSRKLHYDVVISPDQALKFCLKLMECGREDKRCQKKRMLEIIEYLTQKGCHVYSGQETGCSCQLELIQ